MSKKSSTSYGAVCQALLALAGAWLLAASPAQADGGPTGLLNDTGQTQCVDGNNTLTTCSQATTGDAATGSVGVPRQDGRFGRDVASPSKLGGGAAGFDFTPLDASGNAITLTTGTTPVPTSTPSCVKDNITNLIWEVKTSSGLQSSGHAYRWGSTTGGSSCGGSVSPCNTDAYIAALNAANVCGETANDWRLPTRRELLSLVHYGTQSPAIDVNYFPATQSSWYWTSETYTPDPDNAWVVVLRLRLHRRRQQGLLRLCSPRAKRTVI
jgi:hypothetical protein